MTKTCEMCDGSGTFSDVDEDGETVVEECSSCGGKGETEYDPDDDWAICNGCSGSGEGMTEHSRCMTCKGKGVVWVGEPVDDFDEGPGYDHDDWDTYSDRDLDAMASKAENAWRGKDE